MGCGASSPNPSDSYSSEPSATRTSTASALLLQEALFLAAGQNLVGDSLTLLQEFLEKHPKIPLNFALTEAQSKAILKLSYRACDFRPGSTMLINAAARGHVAVLQWLLSSPIGRAPISSWDTSGSPLTFACMNDRVEVARMLIAAGARVNDGGLVGLTALHTAARVSAPAIITLLLQSGADIDQPDVNGQTAEHTAELHPSRAKRAAALAAFAEWRQATGSVGEVRRGSSAPSAKVREAQKQAMAVAVRERIAQAETAQKQTEPMMGPESAAPLIAQALSFASAGHLGALHEFFRSHADIPLDFALTEDQSFASALLINAIMRGRTEVVRWLLFAPACRAVVNAREKRGTPLTCACMMECVEIARMLIVAGARVNDLSPGSRRSPLQVAACHGSPAVITLLLQSGADIDHRDQCGQSAEDDAAAAKNSKNSVQRETAMATFAAWRREHRSIQGKSSIAEPVLQRRSTQHAFQRDNSEAAAGRATESGLAACKAVAFRLAKLALVGAPAVAQGAPLIQRAALESLLYETLICHPVASYLACEGGVGEASGAGGFGAAGHRQVALCDYALPMLRPFLDELAPLIRDEMQRALSSFMHTQMERPSAAAAAMQPQSQRSSAMGSESMSPHDSQPPAYEAATSSPAPAPTFAACPTATGDLSCSSSPPAPTFAALRDDDDSWSPRKDR